MTNKFDYQINQYQKRIFESFSQGGDKLKNLNTSVEKMIGLMFSHDKPHEDNSSNLSYGFNSSINSNAAYPAETLSKLPDNVPA